MFFILGNRVFNIKAAYLPQLRPIKPLREDYIIYESMLVMNCMRKSFQVPLAPLASKLVSCLDLLVPMMDDICAVAS